MQQKQMWFQIVSIFIKSRFKTITAYIFLKDGENSILQYGKSLFFRDSLTYRYVIYAALEVYIILKKMVYNTHTHTHIHTTPIPLTLYENYTHFVLYAY